MGPRTKKNGAPKGGAPKGGESKISRFFSLYHHNFLSFSPLFGVFSWNFGGILKRWDPQMCPFGVLGLSCEAPAAPKPPKLTRESFLEVLQLIVSASLTFP